MRRTRMVVLGTIALSLGLVLVATLSTPQEARHPRVGLIFHGGLGPITDQIFSALQQGFAQLGYVEGRNITIESRLAQGQVERLPNLALELVNRNVDVIIAVGAVGTQAVKSATTRIPIVFTAVIDPVAVGLVSKLERPGGNITGIISFDPLQPRKQFELLKQMIPNLTRVALLSDQDAPHSTSDPGWNPLERANDTAARAIGLQPQMLKIKGPNPDFEGAFLAMKKEGAEALVVLELPVTIFHRKRIAELAIANRVPAMFVGGRSVSDAEGLIAYGTSILDTLPHVPEYVEKILKGANPGEMPIQVITRNAVIFNLRTARAIGVTIQTELLKQADQIIE